MIAISTVNIAPIIIPTINPISIPIRSNMHEKFEPPDPESPGPES